MSVNEEKMFILKMLQDGKITSEEAARLLEALDGGSKQGAGASSGSTAGSSAGYNNYKQQKQQVNFNDEIFKMRDKINEWKKEFKNGYNQKDFDKAVEEFSIKAERIGKNFAATTFGVVDKMIDFVGSFVDTNAFNIFGNYEAVDRTFEAMPADGADLEIEGMNGHILVKKHLEDKIIIKTRVRSPQNDADRILCFSEENNKVVLKLNKAGSISVSHEIYLPAVAFNIINLETSNGKIYVEDSKSQSFKAVTRNSHIDLMGVNSDSINVSTKNARIQMSYVIGRNVEINTNNSIIDIKHIKSENIKAVTMNGKINVENVQNMDGAPDMALTLKTSNGGIKVNMNDMENRGYKVNAKAVNGSINLLVPEMTYHNVNRQEAGGSFVEAESNGFDGFAQKVKINAETVNGYVEIVR